MQVNVKDDAPRETFPCSLNARQGEGEMSGHLNYSNIIALSDYFAKYIALIISIFRPRPPLRIARTSGHSFHRDENPSVPEALYITRAHVKRFLQARIKRKIIIAYCITHTVRIN